MKVRKKFQAHDHRVQKAVRSKGAIRSLCALLCILIFLPVFSGCEFDTGSDEMAAYRIRLDNALSEIEALRKTYEEAQTAIDRLKADNTAANEKINELSEKNTNAQDRIESLQKDNQSAQEKIGSLQQSNTSAQEEIQKLDSKNQSLQEELNRLTNENAAAQEEIKRLTEQLKQLQDSTPPTPPAEKIKIYIDQGHNPTSAHYNTGAEGNGLYEQDLTYTIGILLAALLEQDGRFEVCLSRPTAETVLGTDNTSSLDARVQGAKDFDADFFISLHINSYSDEAVNGIEVYAAEQDSISYRFGSSLLQGLIDSTDLHNRGMKLEPNYRVLKNASMPAVLLEMGFITNSTDAALLSGSPERFAQGIYNGILSYFELTPIASEAA